MAEVEIEVRVTHTHIVGIYAVTLGGLNVGYVHRYGELREIEDGTFTALTAVKEGQTLGDAALEEAKFHMAEVLRIAHKPEQQTQVTADCMEIAGCNGGEEAAVTSFKLPVERNGDAYGDGEFRVTREVLIASVPFVATFDTTEHPSWFLNDEPSAEVLARLASYALNDKGLKDVQQHC